MDACLDVTGGVPRAVVGSDGRRVVEFSVQVEDGDKIAAEDNFLTYSLATYEGTIEPGDSVDVVLLFSVKDTTDESSVNPQLYIDRQDGVYSVNLQN